MLPVLFHLGGHPIGTHEFFVGLGVLAGAVLVLMEARRRGQVSLEKLVTVTGALIGGAIGMRLSGWNATARRPHPAVRQRVLSALPP